MIGARAIAVGDKADDAPYGWVTGIANALEVDRYGDLVLTEALMNAVPKYMTNPVLSFGHGIDGNPTNGTLPAGSVLSIAPDLKGNTVFRARFASTDDAQKVRQLYKDGDMRAFSIHFLPYGDSLQTRAPTADEVAQYPGVQRVITALELVEIACAVVPVNAGSLASGSKSLTAAKLATPKLLKPQTGERAMPKSILTGEQRKAIDGARSAYEAHVKALTGVAGHLEELAESPEGGEADHGSMCAKCHAAFTGAADSHAKLGDAIKAMHVAITNHEPEGAEGDGEGDAGADPADGDDGSAPVQTDPEAKALVAAFEKSFK